MSYDRRNETLKELGVDSLDVMVVLLSIQEATGIIIPEEKVDDLNTPAKIAEFLASQ
jgi:acyl carrier protein